MFGDGFRSRLNQTPRNAAKQAMSEAWSQELPVPWHRESPLTQLLLVDGSCNGKNRFFKIDTWHNLHLGIGKSWVSSCILLLSDILPGGRLDARIAAMSQLYLTFCRDNHLDKLIKKLDKSLFGGGSAEPVGSWSKAALTSNLMQFVEHFCSQHADQVQANETLRYCVTRLNWVKGCFFSHKC